jgi:hypothetical protein
MLGLILEAQLVGLEMEEDAQSLLDGNLLNHYPLSDFSMKGSRNHRRIQ